jgi:hypothetical protein
MGGGPGMRLGPRGMMRSGLPSAPPQNPDGGYDLMAAAVGGPHMQGPSGGDAKPLKQLTEKEKAKLIGMNLPEDKKKEDKKGDGKDKGKDKEKGDKEKDKEDKGDAKGKGDDKKKDEKKGDGKDDKGKGGKDKEEEMDPAKKKIIDAQKEEEAKRKAAAKAQRKKDGKKDAEDDDDEAKGAGGEDEEEEDLSEEALKTLKSVPICCIPNTTAAGLRQQLGVKEREQPLGLHHKALNQQLIARGYNPQHTMKALMKSLWVRLRVSVTNASAAASHLLFLVS